MNTRLNVLTTTSAALLLGLVSTGSVLAQQGQQDMPGPEVDRASCEEVDWNPDLLRNYPWVVNGCQEAIIVDGRKWARFEAEFLQFHSDGAITSKFRNDRGRSLGDVRMMPGPDQTVMLDGRPYPFSRLQRGQILNFYVPDDTYAFTTSPGVPEAELVRIVEPVERQPSARMAEARPDVTARPATLPATAGPLPIIALGGMLSILGGLGLTARRRFKSPAV
ncbi:MAG: hypothetical protein GVY11_04855 [Gammaproteobacteria bacterium]|jgi:hypothetical protein|nr:hypothetical protein [Gammaproteobacteria bacterium]